jgi:hypothetical protein
VSGRGFLSPEAAYYGREVYVDLQRVRTELAALEKKLERARWEADHGHTAKGRANAKAQAEALDDVLTEAFGQLPENAALTFGSADGRSGSYVTPHGLLRCKTGDCGELVDRRAAFETAGYCDRCWRSIPREGETPCAGCGQPVPDGTDLCRFCSTRPDFPKGER